MFFRRGLQIGTPVVSETTTRALAELAASPVMAEVKRHAVESRHAERRRLADEADRIMAECVRAVAALRAEEEAAQTDLARAREAVAVAVARETDARSAALARSLAASSAADKRRNLIAAHAEPAIAEARERLLALQSERPDVMMSESSDRSPTTGARTVKRTSRSRSLEARRQAISAGLAELEMASREVDQADVAARIERIFASIPGFEFHTETVEMPVPPERKSAREAIDGAIFAFTGA